MPRAPRSRDCGQGTAPTLAHRRAGVREARGWPWPVRLAADLEGDGERVQDLDRLAIQGGWLEAPVADGVEGGGVEAGRGAWLLQHHVAQRAVLVEHGAHHQAALDGEVPGVLGEVGRSPEEGLRLRRLGAADLAQIVS